MKPIVYLDQNVLGLQESGALKLGKRDDLVWVYSDEHFAEIRRSSSPERHLAQLRQIGAKLLELDLSDDWKILGTAKVVQTGDPEQHFRRYLEVRSDVPVDDTLFDPLQAWLNGGGDEELFKFFPDRVAEQIVSLIGDLSTSVLYESGASFDSMRHVLAEMAAWGNDIEKTRAAIGLCKGLAGSLSEEDPLEQVWSIVSDRCGGVSGDQFFGFDPPDTQGYDKWPLYLGIVSCCAVLDIIGFQAEKKCRKIEKLPNVRSDGRHIAMGAFCSAILSEDKRLIRRANAVYRHKRIGTATLLLNPRS